MNPYDPPKRESKSKNEPGSSIMFEVVLFGGLVSIISGVCVGTMLSHPVAVQTGVTMFVLGFLALIVTLR